MNSGSFLYAIESSVTDITARTIPTIEIVFNFSPNINMPMSIVAVILNADHIVPTIDNWFFCSIAGSQARVPIIYTIIIEMT